MSTERNAAIVFSNCTRAFIIALGMQAENEQRKHRGESIAFVKEDFDKLILEEGIHWNAVITMLNEGR